MSATLFLFFESWFDLGGFALFVILIAIVAIGPFILSGYPDDGDNKRKGRKKTK